MPIEQLRRMRVKREKEIDDTRKLIDKLNKEEHTEENRAKVRGLALYVMGRL